MVTNPVKPKRNNLLFSLRIIALVLMLALFIFLIIFEAAPAAVKFGNDGIVVMQSSNMKGEVSKDALASYNTKSDFNALKEGDVVVFNREANGKITQEIRYFREYSADVYGNPTLTVYNDTLQDEPYHVSESDFLGVVTKVIPTLGGVVNVLSSNYGLLILAIIICLLGFAPILFAKTDSEKASDRRNKRALERQKAHDAKQAKKKVKPVEELGITCYSTDSYKEAEYERFRANKTDEAQLYACPPSCAACRKRKPKAAVITICVLIAIFAALIVTVMVMQFGATKYAVLDFKTNAIEDVEAKALINYSEFSLSTVSKGDVILVNINNEKGVRGTALCRYRNHTVNAQGIVEIVTYGVDENTADAQVLSFDDVVGVYRTHNNTLGTVFTFITSPVFFIVMCIAVALALIVWIYYKLSNRVVYEPRLSAKAKKVVDSSELATVKTVSSGGRHTSLTALFSVVAVLAALVLASFILVYAYDVKFEPIISSKGATESGAYALYYNNKVNYKKGDIVVLNEHIYVGGEANAIRGTRYIVDIVGDKYYLGILPDVVESGGEKPYYFATDFSGKQLMAIPKLAAIFENLSSKKMIVVYACVGAALVILVAAAFIFDGMEKKRKGLNVKIEANTFALNSDITNVRKINKLPVAEHLAYCNDDVRRSYNYIVNQMLKYKNSRLTEVNEFDRIFVGKDHVLSLGIIDRTLFAYVDYEQERFPTSVVTADVWEKKWKEPRVSVQINDINDADVLMNLINRDMAHNKIKKNYKDVNYAGEYTVKGVLSTESLTSVKTIK